MVKQQKMETAERLIVEQLKRGNDEAYKYLYRHHYTTLCHVAYEFVKDDFMAETLVGDVIFHLWEIRDSLEIHTSLRCYLVRAVRNRCVDYLTSKKERNEVTLSSLGENGQTQEHYILSDEYPLGSLLERELEKVNRYKQSIYQDWKDGEITRQEYHDMKADYEQKTASLTDILARLTAERDELANGVNNEHPALVAFMKYQNISTLTREILIELVDHIKVYENGNISVKFKFADELRRIAEYIQLNTVSQPEAG